MRRRAEDRAELSGKQRGVLFIDTNGAIAEERVGFGWNIQVINGLIAADIHRAHNNAASLRGFQCLAKNVVQLVLSRSADPVHIQHFGTEQANCLRAVAKCRLRFHGMGNVGGNFHTDTISRARFLGQPDALLLAQRLVHAGFLLIVAADRLVRRDHHRPCIAVDIDLLLQPRG